MVRVYVRSGMDTEAFVCPSLRSCRPKEARRGKVDGFRCFSIENFTRKSWLVGLRMRLSLCSR